MAYCTQAHITDRKSTELIAELTGDPNGVTISSAAVTQAINEMSALIDAAVRVRYPDLPFDATNALLNGLCITGAYLILERDSRNGWSDDHREDWKLVQKALEQIASGKMDLRTETETQEEELLKGFFSSKPRLFGRNSLSGEAEVLYDC
jgi:phage gp36-like protein